MSLNPIIIVVVVIILAFVFFKLLKSILKAVLIAIGVGFLLLLIVGLIAYSDMKQISHSLETGDKVLIYEQNEELITGIFVDNTSTLGIGEDGRLPITHKTLTNQELTNYTDLLQGEGDYDEDLIIIIDHNWMWESIDEITALNVVIDETRFTKIMNSNDPHTTFTEETQVIIPTEADIKNIVFVAAFSASMKESGATRLVEGIKKGDIITSPDFISVGIIKLIPDKMFSTKLNETLAVTRLDLGGDEE